MTNEVEEKVGRRRGWKDAVFGAAGWLCLSALALVALYVGFKVGSRVAPLLLGMESADTKESLLRLLRTSIGVVAIVAAVQTLLQCIDQLAGAARFLSKRLARGSTPESGKALFALLWRASSIAALLAIAQVLVLDRFNELEEKITQSLERIEATRMVDLIPAAYSSEPTLGNIYFPPARTGGSSTGFVAGTTLAPAQAREVFSLGRALRACTGNDMDKTTVVKVFGMASQEAFKGKTHAESAMLNGLAAELRQRAVAMCLALGVTTPRTDGAKPWELCLDTPAPVIKPLKNCLRPKARKDDRIDRRAVMECVSDRGPNSDDLLDGAREAGIVILMNEPLVGGDLGIGESAFFLSRRADLVLKNTPSWPNGETRVGRCRISRGFSTSL